MAKKQTFLDRIKNKSKSTATQLTPLDFDGEKYFIGQVGIFESEHLELRAGEITDEYMAAIDPDGKKKDEELDRAMWRRVVMAAAKMGADVPEDEPANQWELVRFRRFNNEYTFLILLHSLRNKDGSKLVGDASGDTNPEAEAVMGEYLRKNQSFFMEVANAIKKNTMAMTKATDDDGGPNGTK